MKRYLTDDGVRTGAIRRVAARLAGVLAGAALAVPALGQAAFPAAFVSNNGNLEGSITSYRIHCDGSLQFIQKYVTGTTPSTQVFHPGTNAYAISLSPNGRHLMVSHATSSQTVEQLTLLRVHVDGTMSLLGTFQTPDSPLDLEWVRDDLLAVTRTNINLPNEVRMYAFDPAGPTLTFVDSKPTGGFSSSLAVHPTLPVIYAQDSNARTISSFTVNPNGTLTPINVVSTGLYPLGLGVSPDGARIYAGGGISGDGKSVGGGAIAPDGSVSMLPASPFFSPGSSPKQVAVHGDGQLAFVAHGTDATCRSFTVAPDGSLAATGFMFDVGIQGSLGALAILGDWLLITDNWDGPRGLYSFTIHPNGSFTQNGPLVDSQGVAPLWIAPWPGGGCPGDVDHDGVVDQSDLGALLASFGACAGEPGFNPDADLTGDFCVGQADLGELLAAFGQRCDR